MKIEKAAFSEYTVSGVPGSDAGLHRITIEGNIYTFVGPDRRRWAFKGETVSFDWEPFEEMGMHQRRANRDTFQAFDSAGNPIVRGSRFPDEAK